MRLLLISDLYNGSDHSAVEAIFGRHLADHVEINRVYFDRKAKQPKRGGTDFTLPHACRKHGLVAALGKITNLADYDWIFVRNLYPVLAAILHERETLGSRVAFWESFPHAYRRYYESQVTGQAKLRKSIEYRWKSHTQEQLLSRCDAYLPITETHQRLFHPTLTVPSHPLPLGFDFEELDIPKRPSRTGPIRFVYAGTIDKLRSMDTVLAGFALVSGAFTLDLFTPLNETDRRELALPEDPRFKYHSPVPRAELLRHLSEADVGLGLIPPERIYLGSSPTKTFEYYAVGLPALLSELPDYREVFDDESAIFCPFSSTEIKVGVDHALALGRNKLALMGEQGRKSVRKHRDYALLAESLLDFLRKQSQ